MCGIASGLFLIGGHVEVAPLSAWETLDEEAAAFEASSRSPASTGRRAADALPSTPRFPANPGIGQTNLTGVTESPDRADLFAARRPGARPLPVAGAPLEPVQTGGQVPPLVHVLTGARLVSELVRVPRQVVQLPLAGGELRIDVVVGADRLIRAVAFRVAPTSLGPRRRRGSPRIDLDQHAAAT